MSDDLVKLLRRLDSCAFRPQKSKCYCGQAADRIEELEAALRRISHAPHGKVFNAHGHEEAYLIACAALENKND